MKTYPCLSELIQAAFRAASQGASVAVLASLSLASPKAATPIVSSSAQISSSANSPQTVNDVKRIVFVDFAGAQRSEQFFEDIAPEPLLAYGAVTVTNADGTTSTQPGEAWLLTSSGSVIDYYHLSDQPAPTDSPTVKYHGYTIVMKGQTTISGAQQDGSSILTSTTEFWSNYGYRRGSGSRKPEKVKNPLPSSPAKLSQSGSGSTGHKMAKMAAAPANFGSSLIGNATIGSQPTASHPIVSGATQMPISRLPAVLSYVGKMVEIFDFYSSSDFSTQFEVYDAAGHQTESMGFSVLASSAGELAQQAQDCSEMAQSISTGLNVWVGASAIVGEAVGGLFAAGAEFLTGGAATPVILTGGVFYMAGLQSLALIHSSVTVPLIAGLAEQQCLNGVAQQIEFADVDLSVSTVAPLCLELEFVCDALAVGTSTSSEAEDVAPADDADYEIVVTGHESVQILGCAEFHYEVKPCPGH